MSSHNATSSSSAIAGLSQLLAGLTSTSLTSTSFAPTTPLGILLSLGLLLILSYAIYQRALPKPIPGIPYNASAARSLLGDVPQLYAAAKTRDLRNFMSTTTTQQGSPIVQLLGFAGRKPTVVINDFATTQDILLRRAHEFERPRAMLQSLRGVLRYHHISMQTSDPQFRRNRELVKDLMTPGVLHTVNAPEIYRGAGRFVELWRLKAKIAGGRPFQATEDVSRMTFDIIKNVAIGQGETTLLGTYLEEIQSQYGTGPGSAARAPPQKDVPFDFPAPPYDDTLESQHRMNKALTMALPIPPWLYHAVNNQRPYMREAYASKERMLKTQIDRAVKRMEAGEPLESALDYMIKRELGSAKKAERNPVFDSPYMLDECMLC